MKKLIFAVPLFLICTLCAAQYDPKALEVLDAMSKKYKEIGSFEADITSTMTNSADGINEVVKGKIVVKGDKYKLILEDQEIFNNGTTVWTYLPSAKEVNIDSYDPSSEDINPARILNSYKEGYKYHIVDETTENGVPCDIIELGPEKKDAQFFKILMVISKKDKVLQSFTMFDKNQNHYKYSISKFNPNVSIVDTAFNFDLSKHPGIEVIDLR